MTRRRCSAFAAFCAALWAFSGSAGAVPPDIKDPPTYPRRTDPDVPSGDKVGDDDRDDNFDGYPRGPGSPTDKYYDPTQEWRGYTPNWTGAFVGGGVALGGLSQSAAYLQGSPGGALWGAYLQASTVQMVLDVELSYFGNRTQGRIDGDAVDLSRHSVGVTALAHPFFLANIRGGLTAFLVPGLYAMLGVSSDWLTLDGAAHHVDTTQPALQLGAGIDFPLDSPQDGSAFWFGVQYKYHRMADNRDVAWMRDALFTEHSAVVRLSYRFNGNLWNGLSGPDYE